MLNVVSSMMWRVEYRPFVAPRSSSPEEQHPHMVELTRKPARSATCSSSGSDSSDSDDAIPAYVPKGKTIASSDRLVAGDYFAKAVKRLPQHPLSPIKAGLSSAVPIAIQPPTPQNACSIEERSASPVLFSPASTLPAIRA